MKSLDIALYDLLRTKLLNDQSISEFKDLIDDTKSKNAQECTKPVYEFLSKHGAVQLFSLNLRHKETIESQIATFIRNTSLLLDDNAFQENSYFDALFNIIAKNTFDIEAIKSHMSSSLEQVNEKTVDIKALKTAYKTFESTQLVSDLLVFLNELGIIEYWKSTFENSNDEFRILSDLENVIINQELQKFYNNTSLLDIYKQLSTVKNDKELIEVLSKLDANANNTVGKEDSTSLLDSFKEIQVKVQGFDILDLKNEDCTISDFIKGIQNFNTDNIDKIADVSAAWNKMVLDAFGEVIQTTNDVQELTRLMNDKLKIVADGKNCELSAGEFINILVNKNNDIVFNSTIDNLGLAASSGNTVADCIFKDIKDRDTGNILQNGCTSKMFLNSIRNAFKNKQQMPDAIAEFAKDKKVWTNNVSGIDIIQLFINTILSVNTAQPSEMVSIIVSLLLPLAFLKK